MNIDTTIWPAQSHFFGYGIILACVYVASARAWTRVGERRDDALALLGGCGVAAIVGGRLFWLALERFSGTSNPVALHPSAMLDFSRPGYTSLGVLAGAACVTFLYWRSNSNSDALSVLDAVIPGGLLGLAVARLGCLANGCDFGAVTELGSGLAYPAGTPVWEHHRALGLIAPDAAWSAATHPFPLYASVGTTIVVLGVATWGRVGRPTAGLQAAVATFGYLGVRFLAEFTRAPTTGSEGFAGGLLNTSQVMIMTASLSVIVLCWVARNARKPTAP